MFNERRKHSRVQILLPTAAWAGTVRYDVTLVNTSAGGAFLVCRAAPPVGGVVEVHLRPEGDRGPLVSVMARVVYDIPRGAFSQPGVGVAWLNAHCAAGADCLRRALRVLLHIDGVHVEDRAETAVCTFTGEELTDVLVPRPTTAPAPRSPSGALAAPVLASTRHAGAVPIPDVAKTLVVTPGPVLAAVRAASPVVGGQAMPSADVVPPKPAESGPPAPPAVVPPAMVPPAPVPPPVRVSAAIAMPASSVPVVASETREAPRRVFAAGVTGPALDHTPVMGSDLAAIGLPVLGMFAPDAAAGDRAAGRTWPIGAFDTVTPVIATEPSPEPTAEPSPVSAEPLPVLAAPSQIDVPSPQPPRVRPGARLRAPSISVAPVAAEPMPVVAAPPSPAEPPRAETPPRHRSVLQRVRSRADSSGFHALAVGPMSTPMPELPDIVDPEQLPEHGALAQSFLPLPQAEPVARVLPPPLVVPASRPSQPLIVPASRPSQPLRMVDAPVQPAQKPLNEATVAYTRPSQIMEKLLSIPAPPAEPAWPAGVPEVLAERYGELKRLGHGGLGVVYRALDLLLDRQVVLKFMAQTALSSDMARRYFLREVKLAASLSHINIIQIYDIGRADAVLYYAMEFVDGRPLTAWLPPRVAISDHGFLFSVMSQLADALDYAHGRNVLHRDVKPDNVIVGLDGTVKLFDFGLARAIDHGFGEQSVLIGTPHYMAPEQLMGGVVDRHTDIYSLGIVLYRMLTGMLPFSEGNVFVAQATQPVPDPRRFQPDLPAKVVPVLEKMLAKKPGERYDSCRDAIVALHAALFG